MASVGRAAGRGASTATARPGSGEGWTTGFEPATGWTTTAAQNLLSSLFSSRERSLVIFVRSDALGSVPRPVPSVRQDPALSQDPWSRIVLLVPSSTRCGMKG